MKFAHSILFAMLAFGRSVFAYVRRRLAEPSTHAGIGVALSAAALFIGQSTATGRDLLVGALMAALVAFAKAEVSPALQPAVRALAPMVSGRLDDLAKSPATATVETVREVTPGHRSSALQPAGNPRQLDPEAGRSIYLGLH